MIKCIFEDGGKGNLRHVTVDTLVIKEKKILLVKRTKKIIEGGKWGLVGGFVGRDETVLQAVEREVFEETGWKIKDIELLRVKDDPNRPNDEGRQNISFVFYANAVNKEGEKDWESDEIKWFDLHNIPEDGLIAFDHKDDIIFYNKKLNI